MLLVRDGFYVSRFFSLYLFPPFFGFLTHDLAFDTMRHFRLSPFSVRVES